MHSSLCHSWRRALPVNNYASQMPAACPRCICMLSAWQWGSALHRSKSAAALLLRTYVLVTRHAFVLAWMKESAGCTDPLPGFTLGVRRPDQAACMKGQCTCCALQGPPEENPFRVPGMGELGGQQRGDPPQQQQQRGGGGSSSWGVLYEVRPPLASMLLQPCAPTL